MDGSTLSWIVLFLSFFFSYFQAIKEEGFGVIRLLNCKEEAMAGTCKSDPVYMSLLCDKSFCNGNNNYDLHSLYLYGYPLHSLKKHSKF